MAQQEEPYCGETLLEIGRYYDVYSSYVDLPLSLIGSVFNAFNVLVFTRKNMVSPVNLIFTHLSFIDFIGSLLTALVTWFNHYTENLLNKFCKFFLYCDDLIVVLMYLSVWLTLMLTIWRYIAVVHPLKESTWCNAKITRYVIAIGYVLCTAFCSPYFFTNYSEKLIDGSSTHCYVAPKEGSVLYPIFLVNNGVLLRLIASVVLAVFSYRLIIALLASKKYHDELTSSSGVQMTTKTNVKTKHLDRSTEILLVFLMLFLTAQVPMVTLCLLSITHGNGIHLPCCSDVFGSICRSIMYFNMAVTFVIYYIMSQQFRTTFKSLFKNNLSISQKILASWV